jgi:hypothetical protein
MSDAHIERYTWLVNKQSGYGPYILFVTAQHLHPTNYVRLVPKHNRQLFCCYLSFSLDQQHADCVTVTHYCIRLSAALQ